MAAGVQALTNEELTCIKKYTDNGNVFVVNNGQDLTVRSPYSWSKNKGGNIVSAGFLGRLSEEKNVLGLIEAVSILPEKIKNSFRLHLIGPNGLETGRIEGLLENYGLKEIVLLEGELYGEDRDSLLSSLSFYIHPAFSDVVSIAVMEAMKLGLPSIITRTSDVSYFYNSGAFVMVEPDPKSISNGIIEMMDRKSEWQDMSEKAKLLVETVFNWDFVSEKLIDQYKLCVSKVDA